MKKKRKNELDTVIVPPTVRKINLPNKKHGKKIDLQKLVSVLDVNKSFKASMDLDSNPYQNYVEISIVGQARIFSNGTMTTTLNLPDEALIIFCDRLYKAYIAECLE